MSDVYIQSQRKYLQVRFTHFIDRYIKYLGALLTCSSWSLLHVRPPPLQHRRSKILLRTRRTRQPVRSLPTGTFGTYRGVKEKFSFGHKMVATRRGDPISFVRSSSIETSGMQEIQEQMEQLRKKN